MISEVASSVPADTQILMFLEYGPMGICLIEVILYHICILCAMRRLLSVATNTFHY